MTERSARISPSNASRAWSRVPCPLRVAPPLDPELGRLPELPPLGAWPLEAGPPGTEAPGAELQKLSHRRELSHRASFPWAWNPRLLNCPAWRRLASNCRKTKCRWALRRRPLNRGRWAAVVCGRLQRRRAWSPMPRRLLGCLGWERLATRGRPASRRGWAALRWASRLRAALRWVLRRLRRWPLPKLRRRRCRWGRKMLGIAAAADKAGKWAHRPKAGRAGRRR